MRVPRWLVCTLIFSVPALSDARPTRMSLILEPGTAPGSATLDKLVLAGDASADVEEVIHRAVLRALSDRGVRVTEPPESAPGPCTDDTCASVLAREAGVDYVIGGQILMAERNYELTLELHEGGTGRLVATRQASCPICSMPEVEEAAAGVAAELVAELKPLAPPTPPPKLTITSEPSGAMVFVDGAIVGTTPFDQELDAGEHRVEIKKEGYVDQATTVTIDPESPPAPLSIALVASSGRTSSVLSPVGWALIGAGGTALVSGVALLALDGRPYRNACDGADVDAMGRCRYQYNTLGVGIAGLAAGVALAGTGVALVVVDRRRSGGGKKSATASLRLSPNPQGLTLSGRF
ncbi:MAG: PEGA domain-containing protein [Myxococcales bacterium]|nr:PEGA domain-containing protein [Myxococcales bacterium]